MCSNRSQNIFMEAWIAWSLLLDRDVTVSGPSGRELLRGPHRFEPSAAFAKQVANSTAVYAVHRNSCTLSDPQTCHQSAHGVLSAPESHVQRCYKGRRPSRQLNANDATRPSDPYELPQIARAVARRHVLEGKV